MEQRGELAGLRQITSPPAKVNAGDHEFAVALGDQGIHFANDFVQSERAAAPADAGNDAERASVIAAVLNLQVRTSLLGCRVGVEDRRGEEFGMGKDVAD